MEKIVSPKNDRIKNWSKLKTKKYRDKMNLYILENWHLIKEAINYDQAVETLLFTENQYKLHHNELQNIESYEVIIISEEIALKLGSTKTPQGAFAIVKLPHTNSIIDNEIINGKWLLLDNVQDPGNIGTMIRTADAAGMNGVVFGDGTSDIFNSKVLRSMQGSNFHIKIIKYDLNSWVDTCNNLSIPVYGSELNPQAVDYNSIKSSDCFSLIMGNEGNGMQKSLLAKTTNNLYIPIKGNAESLNVAVAAGILMFSLCK
ncbi:TrmH family RNA methyltransferase [Apilactobacillus xinyiensis]|uniref:TrmH family RNA methyltransferase n=1 Tax=Apilactobacillus xinyiensis TaxID=2841032 RepID=UPI001C7D6F08|nr:RNA methyltransferase [Apilactobacillus xinyiensis]MCL0318427.1 RNA methyltransferase [Apilactobacillus xinyiensis]